VTDDSTIQETEYAAAEPATVLIVDDHILFREGLAALISHWKDFRVVGSAGSGIEGIKLAGALKPNLVLMDIRMEGMNGVEATRQICLSEPGRKLWL
jgi:DNA-binding NarL/FixJ family response regulator